MGLLPPAAPSHSGPIRALLGHLPRGEAGQREPHLHSACPRSCWAWVPGSSGPAGAGSPPGAPLRHPDGPAWPPRRQCPRVRTPSPGRRHGVSAEEALVGLSYLQYSSKCRELQERPRPLSWQNPRSHVGDLAVSAPLITRLLHPCGQCGPLDLATPASSGATASPPLRQVRGGP